MITSPSTGDSIPAKLRRTKPPAPTTKPYVPPSESEPTTSPPSPFITYAGESSATPPHQRRSTTAGLRRHFIPPSQRSSPLHDMCPTSTDIDRPPFPHPRRPSPPSPIAASDRPETAIAGAALSPSRGPSGVPDLARRARTDHRPDKLHSPTSSSAAGHPAAFIPHRRFHLGVAPTRDPFSSSPLNFRYRAPQSPPTAFAMVGVIPIAYHHHGRARSCTDAPYCRLTRHSGATNGPANLLP